MSANALTTQRTAAKDVQRFLRWNGEEQFSAEDVLKYIQKRVLPVTTASASALRVLANINTHAVLRGGPEITGNPIVKRFAKSVRKHRPAGTARNLVDFYDPTTILAKSLTLDTSSLKGLRKQAIGFLKIMTLMRSGDCASILRSSLDVVRAIDGRKILTFKYRGKTAKCSNMTFDVNYIEFVDDEIELPGVFQPIEVILMYKIKIDKIVGGVHDFLFASVKSPFRPLTSQSIAKITMELLADAGVPSYFTARSLRAMVSEHLSLHGVPDDEIDKRGGWSSKFNMHSRTRGVHYRSRLVPTNFADVLVRSALTNILV